MNPYGQIDDVAADPIDILHPVPSALSAPLREP